MQCEYRQLIYPRTPELLTPGCYTIAVYKPLERTLDPNGHLLDTVKAVGYGLPVAKAVRYNLQGNWQKDQKHGLQYAVDTYTEEIPPTQDGIISFLASGQIKGIGPKLAQRIYKKFGNDTLDILDHDPDRLLKVRGISKRKLAVITESYLVNRGARDVIALLAPYQISARKALLFYKEYGDQATAIVRNHPFRLCEISGIGFKTADRIAKEVGFDSLSSERLQEGILFTLMQAETCGHVCLHKDELVRQAFKLLNTQNLTGENLLYQIFQLHERKRVSFFYGYVYRRPTAVAERRLAENLVMLNSAVASIPEYTDLDSMIQAKEKSFGVSFSQEQKLGIVAALTSKICVITGGPGTGKTMIQKAILEIYHLQYPQKDILCCAPTGRAARRMEQSTGFPASTIHKALRWFTGEDGEEGTQEESQLYADFILIDEVSMVDIFLADKLLSKIPTTAQLVLIGDADQLPSVGPGAVLSEIIQSDLAPVIRLQHIYRQSAGSKIAINAEQIRKGIPKFLFGNDFMLYPSSVLEESAELIQKLYQEEVNQFGIENVTVLSPMKKKTPTGVNALNERLRDVINPPAENKPEIRYGDHLFRKGDRIMQIRNTENASNGDLGFIRDICKEPDSGDLTVSVQFDSSPFLVSYHSTELSLLELGYATSIHKSQGQEFDTVIISMQNAHYIMLKRPLIYTAVTRAKKKVILIGDKKAIATAIRTQETQYRETMLAERIKKILSKI